MSSEIQYDVRFESWPLQTDLLFLQNILFSSSYLVLWPSFGTCLIPRFEKIFVCQYVSGRKIIGASILEVL